MGVEVSFARKSYNITIPVVGMGDTLTSNMFTTTCRI